MLRLNRQLLVGIAGSTALIAALGIAPAAAATSTHASIAAPSVLQRAAAVSSRDSIQSQRAQRELRRIALVAKNRLAPRIVAHAWTYNVTTTTDDTLWTGAPANHCEDTSNHSLCSFRAALATASADFSNGGSQDYVADQVNVRAGDYKLNPSIGGPVYLEPTLGGKLTIKGAGASSTTIDGSSNGFDSELLGIQTGEMTVSISGLTFKDGSYDDDAGAIWSSAETNLDITHCAFVDNYAEHQGGAIGTGSSSELTVTDSSFTGNSTSQGGGAIYSSSTSELVLSGDTFTNNKSTESSDSYGGGAIDTSGPVSVDHSTFSHNSAYGDGGALYVDGDVVANADTFLDNAANDDGAGGALFVEGALSATNSNVTGNSAADGAGGAFGIVTYLDADTFHANHSGLVAGDVADIGQLTAENSSFTDSYADGSGGSITAIDGAALTLINDLFSHDRSMDDSNTEGGGAIYSDGFATLSHVTIVSCFAGNNGPGSGGSGGGIFTYVDGSTSIDQSTIDSNTSQYEAGGIYSAGSFVSINASTVSGNAGYEGGGIFMYGEGAMAINNSTIDANSTSYAYGGGVSAYGESGNINLEVDNSTLANNRADVVGSDGEGGGVSLYAVESVNLHNDTIVGNAANSGGGLYLVETGVVMVNTTIANNFAPANTGGGVAGGLAELSSTSSIIAGNEGAQCIGSDFEYVSGGYNVVSDNSCAFKGEGDQLNKFADLGVLASNGGLTQTIEPLTGSPAIGSSFGVCPATDQRGVTIPPTAPCDAGSVFVEPTTTTLALSTPTVTVGHEQLEHAIVTVKSSVAGNLPTGSVAVSFNGTVLCTATLKPLLGSKIHLYEGSCALPANKLKPGSRKLSGLYGNNKGLLAGSASATKSLKVLA